MASPSKHISFSSPSSKDSSDKKPSDTSPTNPNNGPSNSLRTSSSSSASSSNTKSTIKPTASDVTSSTVRKEGETRPILRRAASSKVMAPSSSSSNSNYNTASPHLGRSYDSLKIKDKQTVGDYILIEMIGKGGYGTVYKGLHKLKGNFVAIKKIPLSKNASEDSISSLMMEIKLLQRLRHPNIVKYIDHVLSKRCIYIVMEYMEIGSLEHMVKKHGVFPEELVNVYIKQMLEGLNYLHEEGVVHRDIKAANILISSDGLVRLADFGVATQLSDAHSEGEFGGTPYWMAPEVITMQGVTTACDIWSLGCTVIELLTGKPPYHELAQATALYAIVNDDHPPLPEGITPSLRDFLMRCFQKDENLRIDAPKLLRHAWIKSSSNSKKKDIDMNDLEREISQYNEQLEELGKKVELTSFLP